MQDSAIMICYRECLLNLKKFNGGEEYKILQFINSIEKIGKMIDANDDILYCMCMAKLDGEANVERFTTSDSSSQIFEQLKERKQKPDETVTSYYDAIIKLCHKYDTSMSQRMMISWLENGVKNSLRIQIKRQMKSLSESARTTQAFLKIAKDENIPEPQATAPEIQLEVKIQGHQTLIIADVATNLITDLLLGNDWIIQNNVIIGSLQRATNRQRTLSNNTQLGRMSYQAELNNHIILPVLSEDANYQPTHFKSFNYKRNNTQKSGFCDSSLREKRKHLLQKCYPSAASLEKDTINILDKETLNYNDREGGHARDEPSNEIENMSDDGIQQDTMNDQNQQYINHKP
ncbi:unnamed protein product [Rotaria socialis]|uniref:Uncharacterized protein n=1 Tax=Rotaria socialis TaxID=392032 RepID=A0A818J434_9BILA|nr:unnamed protein product [Rotaria socialis]